MPLTKIQPSGLDQTLNYSVNKITVSGVDVLNYAQSAFLQANTVYNVANTLSPEDTFARTQANSAYTQANTATTNAETADSKAVSSGLYANAAFIQANAAFTKANTGGASGLIYKASNTTPTTANVGDQWYSVTEDILYQYINDGTSNAWVDISSSAVTTNPGAGGGTNNARSIINSYIFGY
jgi:hypothetical protein